MATNHLDSIAGFQSFCEIPQIWVDVTRRELCLDESVRLFLLGNQKVDLPFFTVSDIMKFEITKPPLDPSIDELAKMQRNTVLKAPSFILNFRGIEQVYLFCKT